MNEFFISQPIAKKALHRNLRVNKKAVFVTKKEENYQKYKNKYYKVL